MEMKYEELEEVSEENFRRLTGVKKETFKKMIEIVKEAEKKKRAKGGRKHKVSVENRVLMGLEYWREYTTYLRIGQAYGISESAAYQAIKWIEETLVRDPTFRLPGKKVLQESTRIYEVIVVDATETQIERPKKNKSDTTLERRNATPSKHKW